MPCNHKDGFLKTAMHFHGTGARCGMRLSATELSYSPENLYQDPTYQPLNLSWNYNCSGAACSNAGAVGQTDVGDDMDVVVGNTTESLMDQMNKVAAFRASMVLVTWVLPLVVLVGVVGNAVSLYLACLAVADSTVLVASAFKTWIRVVWGVELLHLSVVSCKLLIFLTHLSLTVAAWLIVAVTLERFLAVWLPLRATEVCSVGRTRFVIAAVVVLLALVNSHVLWTAELVPSPPQKSLSSSGVMCSSYAHQTLVCQVFPWIHLALYCFLPAVLLLCLNCLILYKLFQHRQSITGGQASKTSTSTSLRNNYHHHHNQHHHHQRHCNQQQARIPICGSHTKLLHQLSTQSRSQSPAPQQFHRRLAPMLLGVSFAWLLLTTPQTVYNLAAPRPTSIEEIGQQQLLRTVFFLLMYVNHALNFFLYCVTGQRFRQELRRVFMCVDPERRVRIKRTFLNTCLGNGRDGSSENGGGESPAVVGIPDGGGDGGQV
nr:hypothetical protein BaRGS_028696 [Batillaria attramentaria]